MDEIEVEVTGLDELAKKLDNIPYKFAQRIQRTALQAGGEVFEAEMRANAPVASERAHPDAAPGELRDSIGVKIRLGKDLDSSVAKIGPLYDKGKYSGNRRTWSPGIYGFFVEYGTKIMEAQPFIRPAYQAGRERAFSAYAQVVDALLKLLVE